MNGGTVSVKLANTGITVLADKKGGTLVWKDKEYTLVPNEEIILN